MSSLNASPERAPKTPIPNVVAFLGPCASRRFLEFFTDHIHNSNTRAAYTHAVRQFTAWCEAHELRLDGIKHAHVAKYIEYLCQRPVDPLSASSVKQHLAAIKILFEWMVVGQVLEHNPATCVRGPRYLVHKPEIMPLSAADVRRLLDSIEIDDGFNLVGLRDRALIALMIFAFARVSAALAMKVEDYYLNRERWWIRLHEKGVKQHELPAHHLLEQYLHAYVKAAGIAGQADAPLFRSARGRTRSLSTKPLRRNNALAMIKRRAKAAGLPPSVCCHSFRATGITLFLQKGGTIENAQKIAGHAMLKTTKLYDTASHPVDPAEIERIGL
jgi:integrase/recombinase XerD